MAEEKRYSEENRAFPQKSPQYHRRLGETSLEIAELAKRHQYAVAREDLTGLIEKLRELPRDHKVALLILSYRKLSFWIDWQCEKLGVPIIPVEPEQTSSICPNCSSRLKGIGYRRLKCPRCGLEEDRDRIAVLNIEKRALGLLGLSGGSLTAPTAPQMTDVFPNRCGEPNRPFRAGRRSAQIIHPFLRQRSQYL
jgi:transposase, IS605 OrfB family, central region